MPPDSRSLPRQSSRPDLVAIKAFEAHMGTRVQTYTLNGVWRAVLHDFDPESDRYAFKFTATGGTEDDALERLDRILRCVVESAF